MAPPPPPPPPNTPGQGMSDEEAARTLVALLDRLGSLAPASLWDVLDSPSLLCAASTCRGLRDSIDFFLRTSSEHASSRPKLAALLGAYRHGGYVTPFTVENSPSLLEIESRARIFDGGHFRCAFRTPHTAGSCDWGLFEDTFKMYFSRAHFHTAPGSAAQEDGSEAREEFTPSEVAAKLRRFLCPVRDGPSELLHPSTLSLIGRLLPDGHYVARWHQLPISTAEHEQRHQRDAEAVLNFSPGVVRSAVAWCDFTAGAPLGHETFLCLPRGAVPDPATREAVAAWAQRPLEEWSLRDATDATSLDRTRLVLSSSHWPRMHPLLPTQPSESYDHATVAAYMRRLHDAADDSARPTALLFEMQADVHLQSGYMILDGHHKIEALRRLSHERGLAGEAAPRINFLVISPRLPAVSSLGSRGPYMDEAKGMQELAQARGDATAPVVSILEAQAVAKHSAALRALHDASQVVCVLSDLCQQVQARAEREAKERFVAKKREEARVRARAEALKSALCAAHVPGLDVEKHCREVSAVGLEAQMSYWEGVCREHGVELPGPEGQKTAAEEEHEEEIDFGSLFD